MFASGLRATLFFFALLWGGQEALVAGAPAARKATRPEIASLTIVLDDGRSYALSNNELQEAKGGAIFWGDWAVSNLLVPFHASHREVDMTAYGVIQYWWTPARSGELPAFLLQTANGPIYPLDTSGPDPSARPFQPAYRPRVLQILVAYKDGRSFPFSEFVLRDEKSGVMVWNDFAVGHLLIPFYAAGKSPVTSAADVARTWHSPTTGRYFSRSLIVSDDEQPGFMVKPQCIPGW